MIFSPNAGPTDDRDADRQHQVSNVLDSVAGGVWVPIFEVVKTTHISNSVPMCARCAQASIAEKMREFKSCVKVGSW